MLKGASIHAAGWAVQSVGGSVADYMTATGNKKGGKVVRQSVGAIGNVAAGAGVGAAAGSVIPVVGTAVGAAIGAAIGGIKSAFDILSENARDAAAALAEIGDFKTRLAGITRSNEQRNELRIASEGPSEARTALLSKAQGGVKEYEAEVNRLADIAKHNKEVLEQYEAGKKTLSEAEVKALKEVIRKYQEAVQQLDHNKRLVEKINQAQENEEKTRQQKERESAQMRKWKREQSTKTSLTSEALKVEREIQGFETETDESKLNDIAKESKRSLKELDEKLEQKLKERQEAIDKGDTELVNQIDQDIANIQQKQNIAEKRGQAAQSRLDKLDSISENKAKFSREIRQSDEMEELNKSLKKNQPLSNLKMMLHDLNLSKMEYREQAV